MDRDRSLADGDARLNAILVRDSLLQLETEAGERESQLNDILVRAAADILDGVLRSRRALDLELDSAGLDALPERDRALVRHLATTDPERFWVATRPRPAGRSGWC